MTAAAFTASAQPAPTPADPFTWMEEIEGTRALDWARAENARSLPVLQNDPRYEGLHQSALDIVNARDRIPGVSFSGDGTLGNFWQDAEHVRGLWRRTSVDSFRTADPVWETVLDVDALARAEGQNWVYKGATCLAPDDRYCLVQLSDGGKDAVTLREFDTVTKAFVEGGFVSPDGKQNASWLDKDTVLIARDWGPGTMTKSSYPFVLKLWRRGTPLEQATEIYRGTADDVSVSPFVLRDADGKVQAVIAARSPSFFETEYWLITDQGPIKLPFPMKTALQGLVGGQLVFTLQEDWPSRSLKQGDLASIDLQSLIGEPDRASAVLILRPTPSQAVEQINITRNRLIVGLTENVTGQAWVYTPGGDGAGPTTWTGRKLDLPANITIGVGSASERDDRVFFNVSGYLTPSTLWLADAASGKVEKIKELPPRFDASTHVVEQFWATSKDGTKVPYFVVRPKDLKYDGTAPTLQYAYGGFQVSMTPGYSATVGKLWLERGGVYVVANIRGGGEFGPAWHEAALKANRQRAYDDFFAVSEDLIARKITSPRRLGIMGGSNGGLLMGVALTQRPELYNAVVIQVPLFDMLAYTHIGAGASWVGEYGDPAIPEERAWIAAYDPYSNLKAGKPYPQVFIETSTKDDRVHPAHARKAAARLEALGYSFLYYENIDGGHSAAANLNETAKRVALEFTYLSQRLMD
ncbi:MAG TPA: prolyl oligopeptidase family serine peptidase [Caulobacter sp.]|nr:prolyl oligopeptidase family serine peptidase [Caulobacter sp.]